MEGKEKHIKKIFEEAQSTSGVDSDKLWNDIQSGLPSTDSSENGFAYWKHLLFSLLFLVLIGAFLWLYPLKYTSSDNETISSSTSISKSKNTTINQTNNNTLNAAKEEKNIEKPVSLNANSAPIISENKTANKSIENSSSEKINSNSSVSSINVNQSRDITENDIQYTENNSNDNEVNSATDASKELINTDNNTPDQTYHQNESFSEENSINNDISEEKSFIENSDVNSKNIFLNETRSSEEAFSESELELIKLNNLFYEFDVYEIDGKINIDNKAPQKINKTKRKNFLVGISAGSHIVNNIYTGNTEGHINVLSESITPDPGYSAGIYAQYDINKSYSIQTGVSFYQSYDQFDFIQEGDSSIILSSGKVQKGISRRTVVHHNKYNQINIPVLIGYRKKIGKVELGCFAGVGLNFNILQEGKIVNSQNAIVKYSNDDIELPRNNFNINYVIRPYMNIPLSENLLLRPMIDLQHQRFGNSSLMESNISAWITGVNMGVFYRL